MLDTFPSVLTACGIYPMSVHLHHLLTRRSVLASAAEATRAAHALLQLLDFSNFGSVDPLEHQLRDAVAFFDLVICLGMVEEEYLDLAPVVGVDDTGTGVDEVLRGET